MKRRVEPELLDTLAPDDPRATRSRRDLQRLNFLMRHAAVVARLLADSRPGQTRRIVELGAGDGTFLLSVASKLSHRWREVEAVLVDRQSIVTEKTCAHFRELGWTVKAVTMDVFDWVARIPKGSRDCMIANLFLHHFGEVRLRKLLGLAAEHASCFIACEPRRSQTVFWISALLRLIGCNDVTRHDAAASVRAGFAGRELSALWPTDGPWLVREREVRWCSHCFTAQRMMQG